tara:strand:+ start:927 stop:1190 length:264 start_codon:yes stop_codon:yes gene_type:complete
MLKVIIDEKANWNDRVKSVVEETKKQEIDFEIKILKINAELKQKQQKVLDLILELQDISNNLTKLYLHSIKDKYPTVAQKGLSNLHE